MIFKKLSFAVFVFITLSFYGTMAFAFDQNAVVSVSERISEYYTAQGGRFRSLIIRPSMEVELLYDDNIFRQSSNKRNDVTKQFKPEIEAQTNWNLHEIRAGAKANLGRYSSHNDENYDDYSYYVSGRYDLDYKTYLSLNLKSEYHHEDRGSLDDVGGDNPIEYKIDTGIAKFTRELGVLKLYLTGVMRSYSYDDSSSNGSVIDNSARDRKQNILDAKLAYSFGDDYSVFTKVKYDRRRYNLSSNSFRNSDGYDLRIGTDVNLTGKMQGNLYIGHLSQKYDGSVFNDIDAVHYGGAALWNISDITSLKGSLDREVFETTLSGSSGVVRTSGDLKVEHGLKENIIIDAYAGFDDDKYEGGVLGAARDNITYISGAGMEYKTNNNWQANVNYSYLNRDFENSNSDYDNHKASMSVKYSY